MVKTPVVDWLARFPGARGTRTSAVLLPERNLLEQIRMHSVGHYSDAELRDALDELTHKCRAGAGEDYLPSVFAIVNEAISRRMGAWRFFDPRIFDQLGNPKNLQATHALADRMSQDPEFERAANQWWSDDNACWESFELTVAPMLDQQGLNSIDRVLVGTTLFVRLQMQVEYIGNILLPACFYQALQDVDEDGVLEFRATAEQLLAGILLYQGKIVEMNAGEGKTIAAAFPAVLHAVRGKTVHVITANGYLAGRDADWLAPVFESLGLSVGAVLEFMDDAERRTGYRKNIVYGALREFGFDFMRDNLKLSSAELVQQELDVAIVDEADHALIDEANIPMIIAGDSGRAPQIPAKFRTAIEELIGLQGAVVSDLEQEAHALLPRSNSYFQHLAKLYLADPNSKVLRHEFAADTKCMKRVRRTITACRIDEEFDRLTRDLYYWVDGIDSKAESLCLTEKGQEVVESRLGPLFEDLGLQEQLSSIQASTDLSLAHRRKEINKLNRQLARRQDRMSQVVRMLWAYVLLKKDTDYLVRDDQVILIDKYTGRGRPDTRYHYGLQAAIEVKEGVPVQPEPEVLGRISVKGFMSQYRLVSGMTGTAMTSKSEFSRSYGLEVVAVPPSNALNRTDFEPRVYVDGQSKLQAIVAEVQFFHEMGRPVLIGTHSIDECAAISQLLKAEGIEHNLLNAANDFDEDRIIREAGRFGAVTVATDMAGRGTDIILEPGLDQRIVDSYTALVGRVLAAGAPKAILRCESADAADILLSAIADGNIHCAARISQGACDNDVIFTSEIEENHSDAVLDVVFMEFGLGLYVIGTENSDTSRVDNQLKGRSGRQGAFGASRFFLSSEDGLAKFGVDPDFASSKPVGAKLDSSGRAFWEGKSLTRHIEKLRRNAEKDAEARRALVEEYTRVFEAQSFAYYRARKDVLRLDNFESFRSDLVTAKAGHLVQKYFPALLVEDYTRQFNGLSEELVLDYKVNPSELWGSDLNLLSEELEILIGARLDRAKARFSGEEYSKLGKLLYLQTSDELWRDHMSHSQSLILGTQLCGHNGRGDLASYTMTSFESYEHFQDRIVDSYLPRLVAFPNDLSTKMHSPTIELSEEVLQILA